MAASFHVTVAGAADEARGNLRELVDAFRDELARAGYMVTGGSFTESASEDVGPAEAPQPAAE